MSEQKDRKDGRVFGSTFRLRLTTEAALLHLETSGERGELTEHSLVRLQPLLECRRRTRTGSFLLFLVLFPLPRPSSRFSLVARAGRAPQGTVEYPWSSSRSQRVVPTVFHPNIPHRLSGRLACSHLRRRSMTVHDPGRGLTSPPGQPDELQDRANTPVPLSLIFIQLLHLVPLPPVHPTPRHPRHRSICAPHSLPPSSSPDPRRSS